MRLSPYLLTLGLLIVPAASAQNTSAPGMPMRPGYQPRPADWNNDGAPAPPRMCKGQGGAWPHHYKACRQQYGSAYDRRTDMVLQRGRRTRCPLLSP